ncbi:MAG: HAD-IIB family hydrolase [Fibrobacterota bacterium]
MKNILITDLDGTLIPRSDKTNETEALYEIKKRLANNPSLRIVFASGRSAALVERAIEEYNLPEPHGIFADVGTSFYTSAGTAFIQDSDYRKHLLKTVYKYPRSYVEQLLGGISYLQKQPADAQTEFKISYTIDRGSLSRWKCDFAALQQQNHLPWDAITSTDPDSGIILLDLLPKGCSKASAVQWYASQGRTGNTLFYAGDSGNDLAVFLSNIPAVIVANTPENIKKEVQKHTQNCSNYFATRQATSGVLEGADHFGWV